MSRYTSKHTGSEIDAAVDRAKAGGAIDTLLTGKAPAGYGLGTASKLLTSNDDLNNIYQGGFYFWYGSNVPANIPTGINYAGMFVIARSSTEFVQIVYGMVGNLNYKNAELRRTAYNEVWYEWEWVHPPMVVGTEYRTTERHQGKPVYVKLVDFGALPNNTTKYVDPNISNFEKLIEPMTVTIYRSDTSVHGTPMVEDTKTYARSWFKMVSGGVVIRTMVDLSADSAIVKLKYTKTTN